MPEANRYTVSVSSEGSGAGKVINEFPGMMIDDTLLVFDLNPDIVLKLKEFYKTTDVFNTNIFLLEHYKDIELFKQGLTDFIRYAIFENQSLCEKSFVTTIDTKYTEAANEVWPKEQKAITKFNGRKFPQKEFVCEFIPVSGAGSISIRPEKMDMSDIVSWFFELEYKEEMVSEEFPFDPEHPDDLPIPLEPGVEMPPIPDPPDTGGGGEDGGSVTITYSIIYYDWCETTKFPIVENHAKPMNNFVTSNAIPQNTVSVLVRKQDHVEIVVNTSSSSE